MEQAPETLGAHPEPLAEEHDERVASANDRGHAARPERRGEKDAAILAERLDLGEHAELAERHDDRADVGFGAMTPVFLSIQTI
jgi:hypothetical protein